MNSGSWVGELTSTLRDVREAPASYRDFGGQNNEPPRVLVRTETNQEVARVFEVARRHSLPVSVRGAGHSSGGQTWAPGGIVLSHAPESAQLHFDGDLVDVPGHWHWSRVEREVRAMGHDLMVATSSLDTTVGGTLSMGGFGVRSVQRGAQVDHVTELELICADGRVRRCSPAQEPDLFHCALTGAGQVGIITRARMSTAPRLPFLVGSRARHHSFEALATAMAWMADLDCDVPGYFSALLKGGTLESIAATAHSSAEEARRAPKTRWQRGIEDVREFSVHSDQLEAEERAMPLDLWWVGRNLWCDYCFDADGFAAFCRFADANLWDTLRGHLAYVMCIAPPRPDGPFALDMRPRANGRLFSLGFFYGLPANDDAATRTATQCHERALDVCVGLGGRPYLYGCWGGRNGLSGERLAALYGEGYARLMSVRAHLDPSGILSPNALESRATSVTSAMS